MAFITFRQLLFAAVCLAAFVASMPAGEPPGNPDFVQSYEVFKKQYTGGKVPEFVEMLWAIDREEMGPGKGWFHPGESRYGWEWLKNRYDADRDGNIIPLEFSGPVDAFVQLDKDKSKVLTAKDLNWSQPESKDKKPQTGLSQLMSKAMGSMMKMPPKQRLVDGLLNGEIGSIFEGPKVGDRTPDFTLPTEDGKKRIQVTRFRGKKPVVLIFGSFT